MSHTSPFAGSWYPPHRADLELLLDDLFQSSEQRTGPHLFPNARGFVVPHAGLQYSGLVAAAAYRHIRQQRPSRAVILGFAHAGGPGGLSIPSIGAYDTPLGGCFLDRDAAARLCRHRLFRYVPEDLICDHSVEIQLPLLQHAAPDARIVPIFVGHLNAPDRAEAAASLASLFASDTIFLVSSDLTHYGRAFGYQPFPNDSKISARLSRLDHMLMNAAAGLDADTFLASLDRSHATLCGRAPMALWLHTLAAFGGEEVFQETLDYQTSGDITGDYDHTVSYGALGYFPVSSFRLDAVEQALLLESAQATLNLLRSTGEHRPVPPSVMAPGLTRKAGVFVSLHQGERLLGCIGSRLGCETLAEAVPELTLRAALDDPRFPTVLGVEGDIQIEISVLSPLKPLRNRDDFRIGVHGAMLEAGGRHALLLPQVGGERGWTAEQFFRALSVKAGLGTKGYQSPGASLSIFQVQVFSNAAAAL